MYEIRDNKPSFDHAYPKPSDFKDSNYLDNPNLLNKIHQRKISEIGTIKKNNKTRLKSEMYDRESSRTN